MVKIETMLDRLFYSDTAKDMTNGTVLLYMLFLWMAQKSDGVFRLGYNEIKEYIGISNVTVTYGIRDLVSRGLIEVVPPMKREGKANGYRVKEVQL